MKKYKICIKGEGTPNELSNALEDLIYYIQQNKQNPDGIAGIIEDSPVITADIKEIK